jgi:hypothetical protein
MPLFAPVTIAVWPDRSGTSASVHAFELIATRLGRARHEGVAELDGFDLVLDVHDRRPVFPLRSQVHDDPPMADATDGTVSPGSDWESHLGPVDQVLGCVEIWERLSTEREANGGAEAE